METLFKLWTNLPLEKLGEKSTVIISIIIIIALTIIVVITLIRKKINIKSNESEIDGAKIGVSNGKNKNASLNINIKKSKVRNSEIGCIKNEDIFEKKK